MRGRPLPLVTVDERLRHRPELLVQFGLPGGTLADALLLDEMFAPRMAEDLRAAGIDCLAVAEDPALRSQDDAVVFDAAVTGGRVLVTNNVVDFERLRRQRAALGEPAPRLVYTSDSAFPRDRQFVGRLVAALEHAARNHRAKAGGGVVWLTPAADG